MKIIDVTIEGKGVGKVDNMAVFVSGAALGDELEVKIIKVCKNVINPEITTIEILIFLFLPIIFSIQKSR